MCLHWLLVVCLLSLGACLPRLTLWSVSLNAHITYNTYTGTTATRADKRLQSEQPKDLLKPWHMPTQPPSGPPARATEAKPPGNTNLLLAKALQQHSGTRQAQCMKQQKQPRVVNTREQSSYTARRNKCNPNSNTWEWRSHTARRNKCNQK